MATPTVTTSLTFPALTVFVLNWTLTDASGNPINNAVVTATLYSGRSATNPIGVPGTPVSPLINITLVYTGAGTGQYAAQIPATLNPPLTGSFTLVIDASVSSVAVYHDEVPAVVETAGSALDLTTVDNIKSWIPGLANANTSADDSVIQSCITAWSTDFLQRTGLGDQSGDNQFSPFVQICNFSDTYDGSGTYRLMLRNRPVTNVASVTINGIQVAQSTSYAVQGWVLDGNARSIALRPGLLGFGAPGLGYSSWIAGSYRAFGGGLRFYEGIQNINVQYSAGYNNTPADIVECANKVVAQNYRRRQWIDEASRAMAGGGGTVRYRDWDIPVDCQRVVDRYTRTL